MSERRAEIPLDGDGRERPIFVTRYPKDPRLDVLVAAFERGDFRSVESGARALLASPKDEEAPSLEVRNAAEDLLRRTRPDPLISLFLIMAVGLFVFFAFWVYSL